MLLGTSRAGLTSPSSHQRAEAFESQLTAGGCDGTGLVLSKSSISFDQPDQLSDPSFLLDFFGGGFSSACVRYQNATSFTGEPATPDGHDYTVVSRSPASARPRRSYACGSAPLAPLDEDRSDGIHLTRRSCNNLGETAPPQRADEAPNSAPLGGSWLYGPPETAAAGLAAQGSQQAANGWAPAPLVDSLVAQVADAELRARSLAKQLRDKCTENMSLAQQLREREEALSAARAEIERLRLAADPVAVAAAAAPAAALPAASRPASHPAAPQPGLLEQLQRARVKLSSPSGPHEVYGSVCSSPGSGAPTYSCASPSRCCYGYDDVVDPASAPVTPPPPAPPPPPSPTESPKQPLFLPLPLLLPGLQPLVRLDTPQRPDSLLPPLARLVSDALVLSPRAVTAAEPPSGSTPDHPSGVEDLSPVDVQDQDSPFVGPSCASPTAPTLPTAYNNMTTAATAVAYITATTAPAPLESSLLQLPSASAACSPSKQQLQPQAETKPPPPPAHSLLAVERRRTDRAHSALLFSSRQAHRLSQELAEVRSRAVQLHEELRDWRQACLDNHRELARLRRAAARQAAGAGASAGGGGERRWAV